MTEISEESIAVSEADAALICRAVDMALRSEHRAGDVCVLLTGKERIQALNRSFRQIDRVTDVLTFPAWEGDAITAPPDGYLGDIAICMERAKEQAEEYGHALSREYAFLAVHGALHLMGYDHMVPEEEAVMRAKQHEILESMGVCR